MVSYFTQWVITYCCWELSLWLSGKVSGITVSCGVDHRLDLDPALLWLWCRHAAAALIQPLAREVPCAADAALKSKNKTKQKNPQKPKKHIVVIICFDAYIRTGLASRSPIQVGFCLLLTCPYYSLAFSFLSDSTRCSRLICAFSASALE